MASAAPGRPVEGGVEWLDGEAKEPSVVPGLAAVVASTLGVALVPLVKVVVIVGSGSGVGSDLQPNRFQATGMSKSSAMMIATGDDRRDLATCVQADQA